MISNSVALANKVQSNLVHFHLWSEVTPIKLELEENNVLTILQGQDPRHEPRYFDYLIPLHKTTKVTLKDLDLIFKHMESSTGSVPKMMLMAIVDFDGSVLYYNVYEGLQRPKN
ncbi:unnamed protein product [Ambrosiozyma monospora]|uniref:Unnamed protein product n=1 Tax=Ambrosiozyma monospora TaxID=43982 RepID=A0ACB5TLU2_AMBMO|nr:unnamed protein product [Ambrosiozyma monospora]